MFPSANHLPEESSYGVHLVLELEQQTRWTLLKEQALCGFFASFRWVEFSLWPKCSYYALFTKERQNRAELALSRVILTKRSGQEFTRDGAHNLVLVTLRAPNKGEIFRRGRIVVAHSGLGDRGQAFQRNADDRFRPA
jgi:hypothetical protein